MKILIVGLIVWAVCECKPLHDPSNNGNAFMETNGVHKKNIHKEIFLGEHDDADHQNREKSKEKIKEIFMRLKANF